MIVVQARVVPKSSIQKIERLSETALKVWLHSAPDKGKANYELIEVVSKFYSIPRSRIKIIKGERSRTKTLAIDTDSLSRKIEGLNKEA